MSSKRRGHQVLALLGLRLMPLVFCSAVAASNAPSHIAAEIPGARLAGEGVFRWFGLKIYDAQFWIGRQGYLPDRIPGPGIALDLRYARTLQGAKIAQASIEEIKKLGIGTATQHVTWLKKMEQIFPDVTEGVHLTGMHLPTGSAQFYLDGKPIGEVADPEFARAFFAIWLDPKTSAPSLREALLRNASERK